MYIIDFFVVWVCLLLVWLQAIKYSWVMILVNVNIFY